MVIDHDMAPAPPAHPPLAPPISPGGTIQAPSPPTFDPETPPRPGPEAEFGQVRGHSRATAGLPPLPPAARSAGAGAGHRFRGPILAGLAGVAVVALVAGVVFGFGLGPAGSHQKARTPTAARPVPLDVPALRQAVAASVVQLTVTRPGVGSPATVTGSGIVVDASGVLVTTADLVNDATSVSVRLADGRVGPGQLLGTLPDDDVAAIRIPSLDGLKAARLGNSGAVSVHDEVVAVGAPSQNGATPSSAEGVVTAVGQALPGVGEARATSSRPMPPSRPAPRAGRSSTPGAP